MDKQMCRNKGKTSDQVMIKRENQIKQLEDNK